MFGWPDRNSLTKKEKIQHTERTEPRAWENTQESRIKQKQHKRAARITAAPSRTVWASHFCMWCSHACTSDHTEFSNDYLREIRPNGSQTTVNDWVWAYVYVHAQCVCVCWWGCGKQSSVESSESVDGICQHSQSLTRRQRNLPSETWLLGVSSTGIPGNSSQLRLLSDPKTPCHSAKWFCFSWARYTVHQRWINH